MTYRALSDFPLQGQRISKGDTVTLSTVSPSRVASMVRLRFIEPADDPEPGWAGLTKKQLVAYAEEHGIEVAGTKAEMITQLQGALDGI